MNDTYVYGLNVKGILSTLISPLEVVDGAIVSGNCAAPCHKNATIHHQNNPVIMEFLRRHGKELCFVGVILSHESTMLDYKTCAFIPAIYEIIKEDSITEEVEAETDLMLNCKI